MTPKHREWFLLKNSNLWRRCSYIDNFGVHYDYFYSPENKTINMTHVFRGYNPNNIVRVLTEEEFQMEFL